MEMQENEHQSAERPAIGNAEAKNVEQFLEPNSNCCIYRLPQFLCKLNEEAYIPRLISIGPVHYNNKELMRMERQKKRYRRSFEERVGIQVLKEFETHIQDHEQSIRAHYSVTSNITLGYAEIILGDVIFIMELFLRNYCNMSDFLLKPPLVSYIKSDLLTVENQLPYSLLKRLYSIAFPCTCSGENPSFFSICIMFFKRHDQFFNMYVPFEEISQMIGVPFTNFTDLLRRALVMRAKLSLKPGDKDIVDLPCATKLKKSGLKFKGTKHNSLLDIQFAKTKKYGKWLSWFEANELQIPTLEIDDETEILLRNLMAWEMFHYPTETHICSYADLMDHLIDTKEDVDLLVEKGIIVNSVGDNEAIAKMFNKLCLNITLSRSCYYSTARNMKQHYMNPWNHAKATLKKVYFNNPWTGTATVAATLLLLLTLMQTICSVIQVLQGHTK